MATTEAELKELVKRTKELLATMEAGVKEADRLNSSIKKTGNAFSRTTQQVKNMATEYADFAKNTEEQLIRGEQIATQYKDLAINIGMSVGRSKEMTRSFQESLVVVGRLGMEASELNQLMDTFNEKTGRARILDVTEAENISKLAKGMDLSVSSAAELAEVFDFMGISTENMYETLNTIVKDSQSIGLNSNRVIAVLQQNMDRMQRMSFAGGVKGMTEMAKLGIKLRTDVSEMLGMASKFYEPEAAIEAAANLQMLGGDIAAAFGDPFEMMYLSRNKPELLAEKVGKMTENMVSFNAATGEFDMPPETIMQLETAAEQLGMGRDSLIDMARQTSKIKAIKMDVSGNITDENMREGIASMARMGSDGKWVVDFAGKQHEIDKIGTDLAEQILAAPKNEEDAILKSAQYAMTNSELMANILQSNKDQLVLATNLYPLQTAFLEASLKTMDIELPKLGSAAIKGFGIDKIMGSGEEGARERGQTFNDTVVEPLLTGLQSLLKGGEADLSKYNEILDRLEKIDARPIAQDIVGPADLEVLDNITSKNVNIVNNPPVQTTNTNINFVDPLNIKISADPGVSVSPEMVKKMEERLTKNLWDKIQQVFAKGGKKSGKETADNITP